jgi:diguanylate cyclase (GGDEF)-like protein
MLRVYSCVTQDHDVRLLAVAVAICLVAQLTSFVLAGDLRRMNGANAPRWLAVLAFITAMGIWATHFVAMLAYQPHMPSAYSPGLTAASLLACFLITLFAFTRASSLTRSIGLTVAIGTMHFVGMDALETTGRFQYDLPLVGASLAVGLGFIYASSRCFERETRRIPWLSCLLFTLAVAAIHFGSMAAITIIPDPTIVIAPTSISAESLAAVVTSVAVVVVVVSFAVLRFESRVTTSAVEEANRMKLFADKAMEGLAVLDGNRVADANDVFWDMVGLAADARTEPLATADLIPGLTAAAADRGPGFFETVMLRPDSPPLDIEAAVRRTSISGKPCTLLVVRDITDRKAAAARIAHLASHDPLTGVGNRLSFNRAIEDRLAAASADEPLGLLCIDLDRFKPVNDLYGHPIGDTVLIKVTRRINALLREGEMLARLGGDEFAVLTPGSPARASRLADSIVQNLSEPFTVDRQTISIGASIGIAYAPVDAEDAQTLHSRADLALYRAKADGRGRSCFFDRGMDEQVIEAFRMKADLRGALQDGELRLNYQPLADLGSGEIIGFEALLRWHHPERGEVSPATFIPLAEETGLIIPIGEWVLREACREAAGWSKPLKIAVNLSPVQFTAGNLAELVTSALAHSGLDPNRLDLEITEGVLVKDAEGALKVLNSLKALGVKISMDDFGTGYSSLSYFRQFPFDKVKIDQGFIQDMEEIAQSRAIIKAIVGLAKGLDIAILAEGVETEKQMDMLKRTGCEQIQGFAISRPAPIEAFRAFTSDEDDSAAAA